MRSIALIVINYNCPELTVEFCKSVRNISKDLNITIAVTDNSGCFAKAQGLSMHQFIKQCNINIYNPGVNLGYFPGAAFAYDSLTAGGYQPDFVIVANPDISFPDTSFFSKLVNKQYPADVLAIGPSIQHGVGSKHSDQNPMKIRRLSVRGMYIRKFIYRYRTLSIANSALAALRFRLRTKTNASPQLRPVYMIHGSFMIFTRRFFDETAGLKFPSFLYGEEIFVAEEVMRVNKTILHDPSLEVIHSGGRTTSLIKKSHQDRYIGNSIEILYDRYFASI